MSRIDRCIPKRLKIDGKFYLLQDNLTSMLLIVCRPIVIIIPTIEIMSIFKPVSSDARRLFAKRLRQIRQVKGLSQEALADLAGLHRTYVGSVERSERNVSIDNMERLAKALEVDITELLRDESE